MPRKKNTDAQRRTAPVREKTEATATSFPVVGVGASAGGLEAFTQLLKHLPPDTGMAFVLVQHLAPLHESALVSLLSRGTKMPVTEATNAVAIEPNHVYVIPPNFNMALSGRVLRLLARDEGVRQHMPIDIFFKSMASERKSGALAVVLSGTGSDGTEGLKAVKAEGGITFAQDEASAKFYEMPRSAILSGCVDFVSSPEGIARELASAGKHPYLTAPPVPREPEEVAIPPGDVFHKILAVVLKTSGVDFGQFRESTVKRRLQRRMLVLKIASAEDYFRYIVQNHSEAGVVAQDILICVTSFFRDPKMYAVLKQRVFPRIVRKGDSKDPLRFWVPGCSTGEEAYSLAIILLEYLRERDEGRRLLVFGTDLSEQAIQQARTGSYPPSIEADVSPQRLRRFFLKTEHGYQISKSIRDLCIFARHDLTRDPPFSSLDLISCRNVLIYFKPLMQKRILPAFHYALKPDGYLVLGSAETITGPSELFTPLDRTQRIYQKKPAVVRLPTDLPWAGVTLRKGEGGARPREVWPSGLDLPREAQRILLRRHTPPAVIIDSDMQVHHFVGRTGSYLEPAPGEASLNLLRMVREGVTFDLRSMVQEAVKEGHAIRREHRMMKSDGGATPVNLEVVPLPGAPSKERYFLVVFEPGTPPEGAPKRGKPLKRAPGVAGREEREVPELRGELEKTQRYLQSAVEEQEATNEEMRAANEEILSSNEELQSTNEELETAKEELQSANEELATVNEELENRNAELATVNSDLLNLLSSVNLPVVILDNDLRIRRFTPAAERIFNIIPTDVGRPISDLRHSLEIPNLNQMFFDVVESVSSRELEVRDHEGQWYSLRIRPYKTTDNRIAGVVLALMDIHLLKSSLKAEERLLGLVPDSIVLCDLGGKITVWNKHAEDAFGYTSAEARGNHLFSLLKTTFPKPAEEIQREFLERGAWQGELVQTAKDGRQLTVRSHWALLRDDHDQPTGRVEMDRDLTEDQRRERRLAFSEERYKRLFSHDAAGSFRANRNGEVLECNEAFARLFGATSAKRVTGSTLKDLGMRAQDWQSLDARLKKGADVTGLEAMITRKDGSRLEVVLNAHLIPPMNGQEESIEGSILDVNGPRQAEKMLRDLARRSIELQDDERQRYGRQLHEGISSQLVALNMNLSTALGRVTDPETRSSLTESAGIAKQVLSEVRSMSYLLHPPLIQDLGADAALRWYVEGFGERSGIKMQFEASEPLGKLPPETGAALFRIVQEGLSNVHRHSGSPTARVRVVREPKQIEVEIADQGQGFDLASQGDGRAPALGLMLMKERAQLTGGRLEIESAPGKGTTVRVVLPVHGDDEKAAHPRSR